MSRPFQIIFTPASSAEMSALPKPLQLEILAEFEVLTPDFIRHKPEAFGRITQNDRTLYRFRTKDYRIYFEKTNDGIVIHRVLNKNSLKDFLYRSQLPVSEDEALASNPNFWRMIDQPNRRDS